MGKKTRNKRQETKGSNGFTLIETLVYLALFAIIIGGSLSALYGIIESNNRNQAAAQVQEEGAFLIGKVDWLLAHAQSIQSPTNTGAILTITRFDGSTATIKLSSHNVLVREDSQPFEILNNTNVSIISLSFIHIAAATNALNAESIEAQMIVTATTSSGRVLTRDFSTSMYLRK